MAEDALARAKELDAYFAEHKKLIGPLHGVPMSTKEHIWHKGRIANGAYISQIDKVAPEDSHLVRLAKNAGAVFHMRTNEPMTLMVSTFAFNPPSRFWKFLLLDNLVWFSDSLRMM